MDKKITDLMKAHRQLHNWSCSASAHEFAAKLHGNLGYGEFPLQQDPSSQKGGFQFEAFLNSVGFTGTDHNELPEDAFNLLASETAAGRYPLVSILAKLGAGSSFWHIVVAVPSKAGVALVDPAQQNLIASGSIETLELLKATALAVPNRPRIHFLTYEKANC
jgi:hypothetical protein